MDSVTDYRAPAKGFGVHAFAHQVSGPTRLTDEELRAHPELRTFGNEVDDHPPIRGWLASLIGSDGENYGVNQASDRLESEFTEQDETHLVRLAALTSTALDALAQLHLPDDRRKVAARPAGRHWTRPGLPRGGWSDEASGVGRDALHGGAPC